MNIKNRKMKNVLIIFNIFIIYIIINIINNNKGKRIGIIAYPNDNNIGNQLLKYAMNIILKRYGFKPILITLKGEKKRKININFLKKFIKIKQINNYYTDINENDFDFLIVNSDQVWSYTFYYILEIGFLSFAKTWNITKFIYGASIGHDHWTNSTKIINSVKNLINQFSGISVREIKGGEIMNKYYGIKPLLVLDPTLLINKNDFLIFMILCPYSLQQ